MLFDYMVYIKNDRGKYLNTISQLLCLVSAAFFLAQQIKIGKQFYFYIVSFSIIIAGMAWNKYISKKKTNSFIIERFLFLPVQHGFICPSCNG
jgi:hypothetical protein